MSAVFSSSWIKLLRTLRLGLLIGAVIILVGVTACSLKPVYWSKGRQGWENYYRFSTVDKLLVCNISISDVQFPLLRVWLRPRENVSLRIGIYGDYDDSSTHRWFVFQFAAPMWMLAAISAGVAALCVCRLRWIYRPRATGHCPACGYDMRANRARCSECGRVSANPSCQ